MCILFDVSITCVLDKVIIRNMTANDGAFVGRMIVEAFKSKYEWAAGKRK